MTLLEKQDEDSNKAIVGLKSKVVALQGRVRELNEQKTHLDATIEGLLGTKFELGKRVEIAEREAFDAELVRDKAISAKEKLAVEIENKSNSLLAMKDKNQELNEAIAQSKSQLSEIQNRLDNKETEFTGFMTSIKDEFPNDKAMQKAKTPQQVLSAFKTIQDDSEQRVKTFSEKGMRAASVLQAFKKETSGTKLSKVNKQYNTLLEERNDLLDAYKDVETKLIKAESSQFKAFLVGAAIPFTIWGMGKFLTNYMSQRQNRPDAA